MAKFWSIVALVSTICYPLIVYLLFDKIPAATFIFFALSIIAIRYFVKRNNNGKLWAAALLIAASCLIAILAIDSQLAVKAYPVVISLSTAAIFIFTLIYPPSAIERIARITEPDLPPEGVAYTRKVTIVWVIFMFANALISAATAIWGSLEQWTLWNSLLSYIAMGTLFTIEYAIRKKVRK